jgi:hypothetical protein
MQTYILALIGNPTPANWEALKAYLNKHPLSEGLLTLSDRMAIRRALKAAQMPTLSLELRLTALS